MKVVGAATQELEKPTIAPPTGPRGSRIVGLDAMRGILLSYGIVVHASNLKIEPLFAFIEYSSGLFRMPAFFFLSGLLAAITMDRKTPRQWLANRLIALGVPLCFGLLVLNSLFFLVQSRMPHVGFMDGFVARNRFTWHLHLWFLFCLIAYTVVAFVIRTLELRRPNPPHLEKSRLIPARPRYSVLAFIVIMAFPFVCVALLQVAARLPYAAVGLVPFKFIVNSMFRCAPYYLLGFFMPRIPIIRGVFSSRLYWLVGLMSIPAALNEPALIGRFFTSDTIAQLLFLVSGESFALLFILVFTPMFVRQKTAPKVFSALSRSAYTIYLLHLLLISLCLYSFAWLGWGIYATWLATILVVFALTLVIHFQVVERYRWARFLLNGKTG